MTKILMSCLIQRLSDLVEQELKYLFLRKEICLCRTAVGTESEEGA